MIHDKLYDVTNGTTVVYAWTPKPDITAYEVALCLPVLSTRIDSGPQGHEVDKLPAQAQRHFTRVG